MLAPTVTYPHSICFGRGAAQHGSTACNLCQPHGFVDGVELRTVINQVLQISALRRPGDAHNSEMDSKARRGPMKIVKCFTKREVRKQKLSKIVPPPTSIFRRMSNGNSYKTVDGKWHTGFQDATWTCDFNKWNSKLDRLLLSSRKEIYKRTWKNKLGGKRGQTMSHSFL